MTSELLKRLHPSLRAILSRELAQGNEVVEETRGDWPRPDSLFVALKRPFARRYLEFQEVQVLALNDPHYWGDQYSVEEGKQILVCRCEQPA